MALPARPNDLAPLRCVVSGAFPTCTGAVMRAIGQPSVLGELVAGQANRVEAARTEVEKLRQEVRALDASMARSVQHVGLVRYNPFEDTGGDQSFALALLDRVGNGVIISSLHGRTATRFYAKAVKAGQPGLSLSAEEALALKQARSEA